MYTDFFYGCPPKVNFSIQIFLYLSNEPLFIYFQFHFLSFGEDPYFKKKNSHLFLKILLYRYLLFILHYLILFKPKKRFKHFLRIIIKGVTSPPFIPPSTFFLYSLKLLAGFCNESIMR